MFSQASDFDTSSAAGTTHNNNNNLYMLLLVDIFYDDIMLYVPCTNVST